MTMHTRSPARRSVPRWGSRAWLAAAFLLAGLGGQLSAASTADAQVFHHTVYVGDGIYCQYTGVWPELWSCGP
jgi:hypothetical protein